MTGRTPLPALSALLAAAALSVAACGTEVESGPTAGTTNTAPPELLAIEQTDREPIADELKLWVSNQSFDDDPVRITISIDGAVAVDDRFPVEDQHHWVGYLLADLPPGDHTVSVVSETGAEFSTDITLIEDRPLWLVVEYWFDDQEATGRFFTVKRSDEPVGFA
ncbi:MAG: hypothetical protein AAF547_00410 [Actinomycetota bacterium]